MQRQLFAVGIRMRHHITYEKIVIVCASVGPFDCYCLKSEKKNVLATRIEH